MASAYLVSLCDKAQRKAFFGTYDSSASYSVCHFKR